MKREIYEVYAKVIDANGAYNTLSGYQKIFDSKLNENDCEKTLLKAHGEYHTVLGTMYARTDRQCQIAMIIRANDGMQIEKICIGSVAPLPDPTYELTVVNGAGSGEYEQGVHVSVVADLPEEGKKFNGWTSTSNVNYIIGGSHTEQAIFMMPSEDITMTATYVDLPETLEE